jgi:hypothetical protein
MTGATLNTTPKVGEPFVALSDQYAVLVSYRCNYTGKLLMKQNRFFKTGM